MSPRKKHIPRVLIISSGGTHISGNRTRVHPLDLLNSGQVSKNGPHSKGKLGCFMHPQSKVISAIFVQLHFFSLTALALAFV